MSNEELAYKIAKRHYRSAKQITDSQKECYDSALEMAELKDKQFQEEKKQLIKRAGDWLELMLRQGNPEIQKGIELMIEQFKQAIEE